MDIDTRKAKLEDGLKGQTSMRNSLTAAIRTFSDGLMSREDGPFDYSTDAFTIRDVDGRLFKVTVEYIEEGV